MLDDIKKTLWATADKLRANMDAAEYMRCPSNFAFQRAALMPPWFADPHAR